jgi:hypothetical protein
MTVCLSALGVYVLDGCVAFAFSLVVVVGSKYARWLGLEYLSYEKNYEIESSLYQSRTLSLSLKIDNETRNSNITEPPSRLW